MSAASITSASAPILSVASSKPPSRQVSWALPTGHADGKTRNTDPVDGRGVPKLTHETVAALSRIGIESDAAAGPPPPSIPSTYRNSDAQSASGSSESQDDAPQTIQSSRKTRNNTRRRQRKQEVRERKEEVRVICSIEKGDDKLACLSCGVKFTTASPYKGIGGDDPNDMYYPWATYYWVEDAAGNKFRRPKGKNCGPCRNTFISGGWDYIAPDKAQQVAEKSASKTKNKVQRTLSNASDKCGRIIHNFSKIMTSQF